MRPYFRHELVSALALLGDAAAALDGVIEKDLVVYLVAAHHGRVRLSFRSLPNEQGRVLGVEDGEELPEVEIPGLVLPASRLSLAPMSLGRDADGSASWTERMLSLRDRDDLGPFRLGFLEAVARLADWRASASSATRS
jgi:CRISPR-associated endonuclease/helicase Cas3